MSSHPEFMTISEYAAHRKCAPSYAHRLRRQGRLVNGPGKFINWAASDAKLLAESDPLRGGDRSGSNDGAPLPAAPGSSQAPIAAEGGLRDAVRRERLAKAQLAEFEVGVVRRTLVQRKEVETAVFTLVRQALERMRSMPSRLRAKLAAESDARKCELLIDEEIRQMCADMKEASQKMLRDAAAQRDQSEESL